MPDPSPNPSPNPSLFQRITEKFKAIQPLAIVAAIPLTIWFFLETRFASKEYVDSQVQLVNVQLGNLESIVVVASHGFRISTSDKETPSGGIIAVDPAHSVHQVSVPAIPNKAKIKSVWWVITHGNEHLQNTLLLEPYWDAENRIFLRASAKTNSPVTLHMNIYVAYAPPPTNT